MKKNNIQLFLKIGAFFILILLAIYSIYFLPINGDDYLRFFSVKILGPIKWSLKRYMAVDYKELSIPILFKNILYYLTESYSLIQLIALWFFLWTNYLIIKILDKQFEFELKNWETFYISIILSGIMFLAQYPILAQTLFWLSGINYILDVFFIILIFYLFEHKRYNLILLAIIGYSLGSGGFYLLPSFLVFIIFYILKFYILKNEGRAWKNEFKYWLILIFFYSLGLYISVIAPGNPKRLELAQITSSFNPLVLTRNLFYILDKFFKSFELYILVAIILASLLVSYFSNKKKVTYIDILYSFRWLFAALALFVSFTPFICYKSTYLYFFPLRAATMAVVGIVMFFTEIIAYSIIFIRKNNLIKKLIINDITIIIIVLIVITFISQSLFKYLDYYKYELKPKYVYLESKKYHNAYLLPINTEMSPFVHYDNIIFPSTAMYYNIKNFIELKKNCASLCQYNKKLSSSRHSFIMGWFFNSRVSKILDKKYKQYALSIKKKKKK